MEKQTVTAEEILESYKTFHVLNQPFEIENKIVTGDLNYHKLESYFPLHIINSEFKGHITITNENVRIENSTFKSLDIPYFGELWGENLRIAYLNNSQSVEFPWCLKDIESSLANEKSLLEIESCWVEGIQIQGIEISTLIIAAHEKLCLEHINSELKIIPPYSTKRPSQVFKRRVSEEENLETSMSKKNPPPILDFKNIDFSKLKWCLDDFNEEKSTFDHCIILDTKFIQERERFWWHNHGGIICSILGRIIFWHQKKKFNANNKKKKFNANNKKKIIHYFYKKLKEEGNYHVYTQDILAHQVQELDLKELKNNLGRKRFWDQKYWILRFSDFDSRFGRSFTRPIVLLELGMILFFVMTHFLGYEPNGYMYGFSKKLAINQFFADFLNFSFDLWPKLTIKPENNVVLILLIIISKALIIYFIYNFIRATRRFHK